MLTILGYGAAIFSAAFVGGAMPLLVPATNENRLKLFISFGAGLLLGMACIHMVPEASRLIPESFGLWFLTGFVLLFVLERFIMIHACEEHGCNYHTIGIAAFAGLTVHGVIEGFALASTFLVSQGAFFVLIAILAHKIPAGVALTSILRLAMPGRGRILLFVAGVALSGPLGLVLAYAFLKGSAVPASAGILLAMSAGTFLYIAACDLLPELHRTNADKIPRLVLFFLGLAVAIITERILG